METQPKDAKRAARAHRILDAAAALILRWGYNKTTIDDIARHAGVAKGTIYLHWKTREELFETLLWRERLALALDFRESILAGAEGVTLRAMIKHSALSAMKRPLLQSLVVGDKDIVGKLSQRDRGNAAFMERLQSFTAYIGILRERGMVRTDLSLRAAVFVASAVYGGFFLATPLMPEDLSLPPEEIAELMAETIHRTLAPERIVSADEWAAVSATFLDSISRYIAILEEQLQLK